MSWSSKNGGDSPWGKNSNDDKESSFKKNSGSSNNDDFFDNLQDRLKNIFPKNNPASFSIIILIVLGIWAASGFLE